MNTVSFLLRNIPAAQNICLLIIQCWTNVKDVGPTLYKYYTNILCLLDSILLYTIG